MGDYEAKFENFNITTYKIDGTSISFYYTFDDRIQFEEILEFPETFQLDYETLKPALDLYHVLAGVSYYKAFPAPKINTDIKLNIQQADFFNQLYKNGLGEFIFVNNLDPEVIAEFKSETNFTPNPNNQNLSGSLVPIGGGKDSLVTVDLLQKFNEEFSTFRVNPNSWIKNQMDKIGKGQIIVNRKIDQKLIELNNGDALNGHVPITSIVSAAAIISALAQNKANVILSNEASANIPNTHYRGMDINHQYSKSLELEIMMNQYVKQFINPNLNYFSLLRPWGELKIAQYFSENVFEKYRKSWSSSNDNFRIGTNPDLPSWQTDSPKSMSVFGMMSMFVDREVLIDEFGGNLYENHWEIWEELIGIAGIKPFECVADIDEMAFALSSAKESGQWPELEDKDIPLVSDYNIDKIHENNLTDNWLKLLE